jgi:tRNA-dihydrouridine synthase A
MMVDRRLSVAPMMDRTDRHDRMFLRLISRRTLLYTEMVTTGAILRGDRDRCLAFDAREHPLALQVGGAEPAALAECARIAEDYGYDEINLNVGCPSERVRTGRFGACLMAEPDLVGACVAAMRAASAIPVTVKCRIGIDERDAYEDLRDFVATVAAAGCPTFVVHARKAVLGGLSPKENREVPPLRYDVVYRLKQEFPEIEVVLNGGVTSLDTAADHLDRVDGVMIGRAAYENPYLLAEADRRLFGERAPPPSRRDIVERLLPYVEARLADGVPLAAITRHILGLFNGQPGARAWRRHLSEHAHRPGAGIEVIRDAAALATERRRSPTGAETPSERSLAAAP